MDQNNIPPAGLFPQVHHAAQFLPQAAAAGAQAPAMPLIPDAREPARPVRALGAQPPAARAAAGPLPPPPYVNRQNRSQWLQIYQEPSMQAARALLRRNSVEQLQLHIDGHAISANSHRIGAYAAMVLNAPREDLAIRQQLQQKESQNMHAIGAMLTISNWSVESKLAGLRHLQNRVEREGDHLENLTFLGDGYLHLLCRTRFEPTDMWSLARFFVTEAGLDCNRPNASGQLPAHLLTRQSEPGMALFYLLGAGTDPNKPDAAGHTLMHHVARRTTGAEILKMCVLAGGDLQATSPRGETLLHTLLAYKDDPEMAQYLLEQGVSPRARDGVGLNAFDYAEMQGRTQVRPLLGARPSDDLAQLPTVNAFLSDWL